jgi:phage terminase small subunit
MSNLTEEQIKFIDYYLETMDPTSSAKRAGYPAKDAQKIGLDLLCNDVMQLALEKRRNELNTASKGMKFEKEDLVRVFWNMYTECRQKGRVKEAKEIIETIARWNGVNPDTVKTEIANLVFNLDGSKI